MDAVAMVSISRNIEAKQVEDGLLQMEQLGFH